VSSTLARAGDVVARQPRICVTCGRSDCRLSSHNGPGQWIAPDEERAKRVAAAKAAPSGIGAECSIIDSCRSRIARLPVTDATHQAHVRVLGALDEYFEVQAAARRSTTNSD
jgi:hypothetical protein